MSVQNADTFRETKKQVTLEEYMETYAEQGYEWVEGELIDMSPVKLSRWSKETEYYVTL